MRLAEYKGIFSEALDKEMCAGFQNMGDISKACKYADKKGYALDESQELRSLMIERNDKIWLMFLLKLKTGNDIVVFLLGRLRPNKYATNNFHPQYFLWTTPKKVLEI